ncbi:MAG: HesA/MoeB/ThiF family protein [Gammaproteobacteria bacterium]
MNDAQLLRYSRQIMLPQVDIAGQQSLLGAKALIVGAGGLGSPAAMYLASAGVGEITLYDDDEVDLSNLQRQIAHRTEDIGESKAVSARKTLLAMNPEVRVHAVQRRLAGDEMFEAVAAADVVLDCCDNFSTRFAVNRACVKQRKALISGAASRFEGQVAVFLPGQEGSPCYNCLYADLGDEQQNCSRNGVIAPLTGIIGSVQALEALKALLGIGRTLSGRLLLLDGLTMEWNSMVLRKNPRCPTCG